MKPEKAVDMILDSHAKEAVGVGLLVHSASVSILANQSVSLLDRRTVQAIVRVPKRLILYTDVDMANVVNISVSAKKGQNAVAKVVFGMFALVIRSFVTRLFLFLLQKNSLKKDKATDTVQHISNTKGQMIDIRALINMYGGC